MKKKNDFLIKSVEAKMKLLFHMAYHFNLIELLNNELDITIKVMEDTTNAMMKLDSTTNAIQEAFHRKDDEK